MISFMQGKQAYWRMEVRRVYTEIIWIERTGWNDFKLFCNEIGLPHHNIEYECVQDYNTREISVY
jgi:hypothetical protein